MSLPNVNIMTSSFVMMAECPVRPALGPSDVFPDTVALLHLNGIDEVSKIVN